MREEGRGPPGGHHRHPRLGSWGLSQMPGDQGLGCLPARAGLWGRSPSVTHALAAPNPEPQLGPPNPHRLGARTSTPKAMIFRTHSRENTDVNTTFSHLSISSYSYGAS